MKNKLHLIILCTAVAALLAACDSEEVKGVMPMADMLRVTETSMGLPREASTRTLAVESNCDWDFTVSKETDWNDLTIEKTAAGLTIQTDANNTRSSRQATLTISSKSGITRTVRLSQTQGEVALEVQGGTNKTLTFYEQGGKQEFSITCNTAWRISGVADWLSLDTDNGTGADKVEVTVREIQTDVDRTATLVISAENGAKRDSVKVVQQGKVIELTVSPATLSFAATGESKTVRITCNADWTVTAADDWLQLSALNGSQSGNITVTLPQNTRQEKLSTSITIASGSRLRETIAIEQAAASLPEIGTLTLLANTVGYHEATLSFSLTSVFPVTASGLCYSEVNTMPTIDDTVKPAAGDASAVTLTDLESGVTYYVRAFATSLIGTAYSTNVITVTTAGGVPSIDDNPKPNPR